MTSGAEWHVPESELASFCLQFATLLAADVKLMPALITTRQQSSNELLSEVLLEIQTDLEDGLTLAAAMSKQPDVFSPFTIQMVRQGEIEGSLSDAFRKLADHYGGHQQDRQSGGGPVTVSLDAAVLVEAIRPFIVTVLIAVGVVGAASAAILIAQERGLVPEGLTGPGILGVAALTLLLAAVLLRGSRRPAPARPSRARNGGVQTPEAPAAAQRVTPQAAQPSDRQSLRSDEDYLERDPSAPIDLDGTD